jgi:mRNA-degrading endonuclease toxin of MazEF toxin-antitoxin module
VTSDRWDVVVVPFPFTDRPASKRRPALTLSRREFNAHGHTVLAMITTKIDPSWPGDTSLEDPAAAGLPAASTVRLKVFTLDNRLIVKIAGALSSDDRTRVAAEIDRFLR